MGFCRYYRLARDYGLHRSEMVVLGCRMLGGRPRSRFNRWLVQLFPGFDPYGKKSQALKLIYASAFSSVHDFPHRHYRCISLQYARSSWCSVQYRLTTGHTPGHELSSYRFQYRDQRIKGP